MRSQYGMEFIRGWRVSMYLIRFCKVARENAYTYSYDIVRRSAVILVVALMLAASLYEGYLERRYRILNEKDLELAHENHKQTVSTSVRFIILPVLGFSAQKVPNETLLLSLRQTSIHQFTH